MNRNRQTPPRHHRPSRIKVNGRLYEAVSPRSRSHRSAKRLNESYDGIYKTLTHKEWESLKDYITKIKVENDAQFAVEDDYESAVNFLSSIHMKIDWYNDNFGWYYECTVAPDDDWWFGYDYDGEVSGEIPSGESDGYFVGEGLLDIWKKNRSKLKNLMDAAYKAYPEHYGNGNKEEESKYDKLVEKLEKEVEKIAKKLAEEIGDIITKEYEYYGSEDYIKELIDDGIVNDEVSEWLLDQEDAEYADNESYRPMRRRNNRYHR